MSSLNIRTIGDLRKAIEHMNDNDLVVLETTDLETNDAIDLFPFYVDEIEGITGGEGEIVSEIRFCQMNNVQKESDKDELKKEIEEYIKEHYTDKYIIYRKNEFPKNHLFCMRKAKFEFAEYQKLVEVYIY